MLVSHFTEENSYFGEKNGTPRFTPDPAFSTRPRVSHTPRFPHPGTPVPRTPFPWDPVPRPRVFHLAVQLLILTLYWFISEG